MLWAPKERAAPAAYVVLPRETVARELEAVAVNLTVPDTRFPLHLLTLRRCPLIPLRTVLHVTSSTWPAGPCGPVAPGDPWGIKPPEPPRDTLSGPVGSSLGSWSAAETAPAALGAKPTSILQL